MAANNLPFFPNTSKTKTISVTTTSASATLDAQDVAQVQTNGQTVGGKSAIRIANAGTATVFIRMGKGAQIAVATDMPILPGATEVFGRTWDTDTVAAIAGTGTATLYITSGEGL